jgi:hypothetical protein
MSRDDEEFTAESSDASVSVQHKHYQSPAAPQLVWWLHVATWLPSVRRTMGLQLLFAEALLLFYVLSYGQLMDAVCDLAPLFDQPQIIGPAVSDVYMSCGQIPLPYLFEKLNCSRFVVDGGRFPNVYPSANVTAECCHIWALYDICADAGGFPLAQRSAWLDSTPQRSGTVGSVSGPFRRHNQLLAVSHAVMFLLFIGTLGLQYFADGAKGKLTFSLCGVEWHFAQIRFCLVLLIGCAQSLATVVFGGSTAPGNGVCWRSITLIRSLNAWVVIAVGVAVLSWAALVRTAIQSHGCALQSGQSRRLFVGCSVALPFVAGVLWLIGHYFAWHAVAAQAMEFSVSKCTRYD